VAYDYNHIVSYLTEHKFSILDNLISATIGFLASIFLKNFKLFFKFVCNIPVVIWHILVFLYNTFFPFSQMVVVAPVFYFIYKIREFWLLNHFGLVFLFIIFTIIASIINIVTLSITVDEIDELLSDYSFPEDPFAEIKIKKIQRT
jgi:hypothetical protein